MKKSNKDIIIEALKRADRISGQKLAQYTRLSRTAVWKHIQALRKEGYQIESSPKVGYQLKDLPNQLLPREIKFGLKTSFIGQEVYFYNQVDSSQKIARQLAEQGKPEGTAVIAEKQTQGQGRIKRSWYSLPKGLALSLILRPTVFPEKATHFSLLAGVAAVKCLREVCPVKTELKWPNDIFVKGKKVGGILVELSAEADRINYLILGLGLNVNSGKEDLPEDILQTATSLKAETGFELPRLELVQKFFYHLENSYLQYLSQGFFPILEAWKKMNNTLGQQVMVNQHNKKIIGQAEDLTETGGLRLKTSQGELIIINSGDISLRTKPGQ